MSLSENPDLPNDSEEEVQPDQSAATGLDIILDDGESDSDESNAPPPYIPAVENEESPDEVSEAEPAVDEEPSPTSTEAEVQSEPGEKQQYIPGMEIVSTGVQAEASAGSKSTGRGISVLKIGIILLVLTGGGYLGYQKYWKHSDDSKDQTAREGSKIDESKIILSRALPDAGVKAMSEDLKITPVPPNSTPGQIQKPKTNLFGFFGRAKAAVGAQKRKLREAFSNTITSKSVASSEVSTNLEAPGTTTTGKLSSGDRKGGFETSAQKEPLVYTQAPTGFKLTGTMIMNGSRLVFVNDKVFTVGKVVNGATVVKIGHRWVEMKQENKLFRLNME